MRRVLPGAQPGARRGALLPGVGAKRGVSEQVPRDRNPGHSTRIGLLTGWRTPCSRRLPPAALHGRMQDRGRKAHHGDWQREVMKCFTAHEPMGPAGPVVIPPLQVPAQVLRGAAGGAGQRPGGADRRQPEQQPRPVNPLHWGHRSRPVPDPGGRWARASAQKERCARERCSMYHGALGVPIADVVAGRLLQPASQSP